VFFDDLVYYLNIHKPENKRLNLSKLVRQVFLFAPSYFTYWKSSNPAMQSENMDICMSSNSYWKQYWNCGQFGFSTELSKSVH